MYVRLLLSLALLPTLLAFPVRAAVRYDGLAYAAKGGVLLYRERHWDYVADGQARHLVLYGCPDGTAFARKLLRASPSTQAPDFDFVDARSGYREGVRRSGRRREVYWRANGESTQKSLPAQRTPVIDAGFDSFVRAHWPALSSGQSVSAAFLIPSRMDFLGVRINKTSDDGKALHLRMQLDNWIGFALPTVQLDYADSDHRLLRFQGTGTIRDANGRNQDVRIEFPPSARHVGVDQAEITTALQASLVGHCSG